MSEKKIVFLIIPIFWILKSIEFVCQNNLRDFLSLYNFSTDSYDDLSINQRQIIDSCVLFLEKFVKHKFQAGRNNADLLILKIKLNNFNFFCS